jgi:hypothetical protein
MPRRWLRRAVALVLSGMERPMIEIRVGDCCYKIVVGDDTRRRLVRHFQQFLAEEMQKRSLDAQDASQFDRDQIEAEPWTLMRELLWSLEDDTMALHFRPDATVEHFLASWLARNLTVFQSTYLADPGPDGFLAFVERASRTGIRLPRARPRKRAMLSIVGGSEALEKP